MRISSYKKKNGERCYRVQGHLGRDPETGKNVEITRQGFKSRKDAQLHFLREQELFELQKSEGTLLPSVKFNKLATKWLDLYKPSVSESTFYKTNSYFNNYILPDFGDMFVDKLSTEFIYKQIIQWPKRTTKSDIIFRYLKKVFELAINLGYINDNPTKNISPPKSNKRQNINNKIVFIEKEDLATYLEKAEKYLPNQWYIFIRLLAFSGLRRGEALALLPSDLKGNAIEVNKTLSTGADGKQIVNPPKTEKSYRTIQIDKETMELLRTLIEEGDKPLFRNSNGDYWSLSRPGYYMERLSILSDVPRITPHALRHTHCSLLFEAGAEIKEVQERLGHEKPDITISIYTHVSRKRSKSAVNKLAQLMDNI